MCFLGTWRTTCLMLHHHTRQIFLSEWIKDPKGEGGSLSLLEFLPICTLACNGPRARTLCISSIAPARKMLTQILNVQQPNDSTSRRISLNLTPSLYERTKLLSGAVMDAGMESSLALRSSDAACPNLQFIALIFCGFES